MYAFFSSIMKRTFSAILPLLPLLAVLAVLFSVIGAPLVGLAEGGKVSAQGASGGDIVPVSVVRSSRGADKNALSGVAERAFLLNEEGVKLVLKGDREAGIVRIQEALQLDPSNTVAMYNIAGLHLTDGKVADAIKVMRRAVELEPKDLSYLNRLAEAHLAGKDVSGAVGAYEKIVAVDPSYEQALLRLGTLYGVQKDFERAESTLRRALKLHRDDPRVLSNLGTVLVASGKYSEGYSQLLRAYELDRCPENAKALAMASEGAGKLDEALRYYRIVLEANNAEPGLVEHIEKLEKRLSVSN